jgi:membrane associated rhomboid family serine protease
MRLSGRKSSFSTQRWTQRQRLVLLTLIGTNLAVFFGQLLVEAYQPGFVRDYLALSKQGIHDAYAWQFVTAMFLHNGPWHLLGNMLLLYFLGRDVESILGQRHFLYLYLAGSIGGELGHLFLMPPDSALFAASGGVAAVLVAYATILPELELTAVTFFAVPLRLKAKHLAYGAIVLGLLLICIDRTGAVSHSACLGGCAAGWLYAHLLGFGQPSFLQRALRQRRAAAERYRQMTLEEFITEEIDPLLDKISRTGIGSLTRAERRTLSKVREKVLDKTPAE